MEYNGTVYVMVRQHNGEYYMVPKQHASKFNRRTKLVLQAMSSLNPTERAECSYQIIKVNRSIPKSVVAFPVEQFNRMVCKHQVPALKLAAI